MTKVKHLETVRNVRLRRSDVAVVDWCGGDEKFVLLPLVVHEAQLQQGQEGADERENEGFEKGFFTNIKA
ncbi:hypothetical protein L195_g057089, partial [Trifolium pratense]